MFGMATPELGLRERKKQQTRQLIAETARELFSERGFEAVPVAEIARTADVSEKTVFNYFPTKEDLVYWRLESFEEELLAAIRDREPGEPALAAFARFILVPRGMLAAGEHGERLAGVARMIEASPALLAREQQVFARYTDALAAVLAEETGAEDPEPWIAANAMMGLHRALVSHARRRVGDGVRNPALARDVRARGRRAVELLETGLGAYAVRPG
jgi:AcrR family transcriptional regulator